MKKLSVTYMVSIIGIIFAISLLMWLGTDSFERYQERGQQRLEQIMDNM